LVKVFRICHVGEIKANQAKMYDAKVALANVVDKVPDIYNANEGWVVKKITLSYANRIIAILLIIYQNNKV
jgi:hypothetical protein